MREGRIAQHGDPVTVYRGPVDLHVARLIGPTLELDGVVASGAAETVLGRLAINGGVAGPARIVLRPEQIVAARALARVSLWRFGPPCSAATTRWSRWKSTAARLHSGWPVSSRRPTPCGSRSSEALSRSLTDATCRQSEEARSTLKNTTTRRPGRSIRLATVRAGRDARRSPCRSQGPVRCPRLDRRRAEEAVEDPRQQSRVDALSRVGDRHLRRRAGP